ncbi:hypothetical protein NIES4071_81650 [Calothrix sp. NIES-4071]|nr:hypothetical protein NIES4071_81650 [Calothrix sp. NIES-4071]BAZ62434.1 hypothetical protein NIES4105_81580 [Calothrix sp. NIES-4105]
MLQFVSIRSCLIIAASVYVFSTTAPVFAAEQIVLKYRVFRQSFPVKELSTLADTGKPSLALRATLALAKQDPQKVRNYLTAPVPVNPVILDRVLNSPVGNVILDQISQVIHTPTRKADRQAMRSALVLSAAKDNDIKLIEVIRNYPTTEVEVDGDNLEKAYRQLRSLQGSLQNILGF